MFGISACLVEFLIFDHLVVFEESFLTSTDDIDLVFPDNSQISDLFTPIDGSLSTSSFEMTENNDATKNTNLFLANEESDFCASSSSLPVTDIAAESDIGLAARGDSCVNPDTSGTEAGAKTEDGIANLDPIYTPEDEALRTMDEARNWWCTGNILRSLGWVPVCSTELIPSDRTGFYVEGTQSKLFVFDIIHHFHSSFTYYVTEEAFRIWAM